MTTTKKHIVLITGSTWQMFANHTGNKLVSEYPDAGEFNRREAVALADKIANQFPLSPSVSAFVVTNYGLTDERRTEVCR